LSATVARPTASARERVVAFLGPYARDLALLAVVTFVLRVAWVLVYGRVATGPNDTLFYEIAASNLADGRGYTELFGTPTAGWPPGFPFLMSLGYRIVGNHHKLVFVLNIALATTIPSQRTEPEFDVDMAPATHMAFFRYEDRPGMVGTVGRILGEAQVNIAGMQVARDTKGGHALVALSVDSAIPGAVLEEIRVAIDAASVRAVDLTE